MRAVMAKEKAGDSRRTACLSNERLLALGLQDFLAAVETGRGNVVTQMNLARGRLDGQRRVGQEIVSAMHTTLGRGLLVLLNGHVATPKKISSAYL